MTDSTEGVRHVLADLINSRPSERADLEADHGQVWDTSDLIRDFEVIGFAAPFVVVKRKADGKKGSLLFQHMPRYYFEFRED